VSNEAIIEFLQTEVFELRDLVNQLRMEINMLNAKIWEHDQAFNMIDKGINDHADLHGSLNGDIHQIRITAEQVSYLLKNRGKKEVT
jgi:vacuolar-type H+-ATPase catalytic subunit A/Vma1